MLILPFNVGEEVYAIDSDYVVEVVPRVKLKIIPHVPEFVVGMLNFNELPVPVVDMCLLIENRPSSPCLHTRIVILSNVSESEEILHLGIIGEKITETCEQELSKFIDSGVRLKDLPYLDGVLNEKDQSIQLIDVDRLFQFLKGILFQ